MIVINDSSIDQFTIIFFNLSKIISLTIFHILLLIIILLWIFNN